MIKRIEFNFILNEPVLSRYRHLMKPTEIIFRNGSELSFVKPDTCSVPADAPYSFNRLSFEMDWSEPDQQLMLTHIEKIRCGKCENEVTIRTKLGNLAGYLTDITIYEIDDPDKTDVINADEKIN